MPTPAARFAAAFAAASVMVPALCAVLAPTGCAPPIDDRSQFCSWLESNPVPAGRTLFVTHAFTETSGTNDQQPLQQVDVDVTVAGSTSGAGAIGVCPGDCMAETDASKFVGDVKLRTDDSGVMVYTVNAGASASGYLLFDFGDQTCVAKVQ